MKNLLVSVSKANNRLLKEVSIDDALNLCIGDIGREQGLDRCYIFKNIMDNGVLKLLYKYEWCSVNVETYIDNPYLSGLSYQQFPGLYNSLALDEPVYGFVKDIENKFFKKTMELQSIKSFLFTPIFSRNIFWGWIGYDDCVKERLWTTDEVYALHTIAKNIGLRLNQDAIILKLEQTLKKSNFYMSGSDQALWELNIETNKAVISDNWMVMLGYSNSENLNGYDIWIKSVHPDDSLRFVIDLENYIAGRLDCYEGTVRVIHKEGHYIWIKYSGLLEKNIDGTPKKIIGTYIDISELKEKEDQLKLSEEKFKFLAENSYDLMCQHTIDGSFTYISPSIFEILGYLPDELLNKNPADFIDKNDLQNCKNYYSTFIKKRQNGVLTFRFRHKNNSFVWFETSTKVILDSQNNLIGFQTSNRDISERIKIEKVKTAAFTREKKFHQLKSEFVSMASHQFRTPLTVIYSNAELLDLKIEHLDKKINKDLRSISSRIKNEVDRMAELMDNILIFGKYDSKKIKLKIQPIEFNEFIKIVIKTYFDDSKYERKIKVQTKGNKKTLFSDETLIVHIVTNLISNAFKYSAGANDPLLVITYLEEKIEIEVVDYGIGIPENEIKYLFTSFFRASNTSTIIGSGLGLAIVKQFTELLGGFVEVNTRIKYGTTIKLTFPYGQK